MLITKKSPRESKLFRSRFAGPGSPDFALRQLHRCRGEYYACFLHGALLLAFLILLGLFGRALWHLFDRHGAQIAPWYRWVAMGGLALMMGSVARRMVGKVGQARWLRGEMAACEDTIRRDEHAE